MKIEKISRHIFEKRSNIKFHEDASSRCRDVHCGRTDRHTAKLIFAFRSFATSA